MKFIIKYIFSSLIILSFCLAGLQGQYTHGVVILTSGEKIEGTILHQGIETGVTIEDESGTVHHFPERKIASISQAPGRSAYAKSGIYVREKGTYSRFSFGMGFTEAQSRWQENSRTLLSNPAFEGIFGYRFSNKVNLGIGTGIRWYDGGTSIMPLFLDFRGDIDLRKNNKAVVPHYVLNLGYGLLAGQRWDVDIIEQRGGLLGYGGLGLKMRSRGRVEWTYTIGFRRQSTYEEYRPFNNQNTFVKGTRAMQSLSFDLGVLF